MSQSLSASVPCKELVANDTQKYCMMRYQYCTQQVNESEPIVCVVIVDYESYLCLKNFNMISFQCYFRNKTTWTLPSRIQLSSLLTGRIFLRPHRKNSLRRCIRKSRSSGEVTSALISCMHATWRPGKKQGKRDERNAIEGKHYFIIDKRIQRLEGGVETSVGELSLCVYWQLRMIDGYFGSGRMLLRVRMRVHETRWEEIVDES